MVVLANPRPGKPTRTGEKPTMSKDLGPGYVVLLAYNGEEMSERVPGRVLIGPLGNGGAEFKFRPDDASTSTAMKVTRIGLLDSAGVYLEDECVFKIRFGQTATRGTVVTLDWLTETEKAQAAIEAVLVNLIVDHPMWAGVDYSQSREVEIVRFCAEAAERIVNL